MVIRLRISYRRIRKVLALFIAVAVVCRIFLQFRGNSIEATWYNDGWKFRKKIVIDKSKVSGTSNFSNFPVLIKITDPDLKKFAQPSGNDILFTNVAGTKLNH